MTNPPIRPNSSMIMAKMKSEYAWGRKSRSLELPGPQPKMLLLAMAHLGLLLNVEVLGGELTGAVGSGLVILA